MLRPQLAHSPQPYRPHIDEVLHDENHIPLAERIYAEMSEREFDTVAAFCVITNLLQWIAEDSGWSPLELLRVIHLWIINTCTTEGGSYNDL